jgi:Uncharacterized low-complexity proteins
MDSYTMDVLKQCGINESQLRKKDLSGANLSQKNLSGLDFRGFSLEKTNFEHSNLSGTDLRGVQFTATNCVEACFVGADLRSASLSFGYFHRADFRGADLRGAFLQDSLCSGCVFSGADLRGAQLGYEHYDSDFRGADLRGITMPADGDFKKLNCDISDAQVSSKKKTEAPNKRALQRIQVFPYLQVFDGLKHDSLGMLIDITTQGMRLDGDQPFAIGTVYILQVVLPDAIPQVRTLELEGRCRWCKNTGETNSFHAGFKFENIAKKNLVIIQKIIDQQNKTKSS